MKDRIKELRKALALNQEEFGTRLGVSNTAVSKWEKGERSIPDSAVLLICRDFGCSETWLRTGAGEMFRPRSRQAELGALIRSRLVDRPESFQTALITTLLRFDPDGPEWAALERIMSSLEEEMQKDREP
jgi:transcriptional regulator with XRE-family HTH domain